MRYHSGLVGILTRNVDILGTVLGGQFDWGGRLPKITEASKGSLSLVVINRRVQKHKGA